jgi:uncharacterized protein
MILIDANLLLYAHNRGVPQHNAAREWFADVLSGDDDVALPWAVIHTFLRLSTAGSAFAKPLTMEEALFIVDHWLATACVNVVEAGPRYWATLRRLCINSHVRGKLLSDAHLAALAIEHAATMYTTDADFKRFAGLRIVNPIA